MLFSRWNVRDESVVGWAPLCQSALLAPTQIVLALPFSNPLFWTYLSNIWTLNFVPRASSVLATSRHPHHIEGDECKQRYRLWFGFNITTFLSLWGLGVAQRSWARSTKAEPVVKETSWRKGRSDRGLAVSQIHTSDSLSWILLHGSS
jgi:hypothetical protein